MKVSVRTALKRIVDIPLGAAGLSLVRTTSLKGSADSVQPKMPFWKKRMVLAKELGFSPNVILDGGAYRGLWSQKASQVFPGAQLVLAEPNPFVKTYIESNMALIKPIPKILNVALGEAPGRSKFNIWRDKETDQGASLLPHLSGEACTTVDVDVDTIDNIADRLSLTPDLVKLDLQGGELSALKGATRVLRHAEFMIIEFGCLEAYVGRTTPRDLLEIMYDNDYCLYDAVDFLYRPYDGAMTGGDFFFVKNSSDLRRYKGWE